MKKNKKKFINKIINSQQFVSFWQKTNKLLNFYHYKLKTFQTLIWINKSLKLLEIREIGADTFVNKKKNNHNNLLLMACKVKKKKNKKLKKNKKFYKSFQNFKWLKKWTNKSYLMILKKLMEKVQKSG